MRFFQETVLKGEMGIQRTKIQVLTAPRLKVQSRALGTRRGQSGEPEKGEQSVLRYKE